MNLPLKAKYSFYSALVFFLVANPETYKVVQKILGGIIGTVADSAGAPTSLGLIVHTVIFFSVMLALMAFPRI